MTPEQKAEIEQIKASRQMSPEQSGAVADRSAYRSVFDDSSGLDQFMVGVGKAPMQLWYGGKDLLGLADEEDKQTLRMMEEQHGAYSGAGEIVGDVAMMLAPGGAVVRGANTGLKGASTLAKGATMLAGETALTGAYEGIKAPEAGETRLDNAGEAMKWSLALGIPLSAARHLIPNVPVSDEARQLLDEGIPLTPGMASNKGIRTGAEKFMSVIPGLSGKVGRMQDAAIEGWNKVLMNKTVPLKPNTTTKALRELAESAGIDPTPANLARLKTALAQTAPDVSAPGHKGFAELQKQFKQAYNEVWGEVTPDNIRIGGFTKGLRESRKLVDSLPADSIPAAEKTAVKLRDMMQRFKATGETGLIENMDDLLRESATGATDHLTGRYYASLRKALRDGVDPLTIKNLKSVDGSYRKFKVLEKAGSYVKSQEAGAVFTPRNLESAVKAKNNPALTTTGRGAMQKEATTATESIAKVLPGRSEISVGADLVKWGTLLGVGATGGGALVPLAGARGALNESMRKFLTGTPLSQFNLPADVMNAFRQAGVTYLNDIQDPVMKNAITEQIIASQPEPVTP